MPSNLRPHNTWKGFQGGNLPGKISLSDYVILMQVKQRACGKLHFMILISISLPSKPGLGVSRYSFIIYPKGVRTAG